MNTTLRASEPFTITEDDLTSLHPATATPTEDGNGGYLFPSDQHTTVIRLARVLSLRHPAATFTIHTTASGDETIATIRGGVGRQRRHTRDQHGQEVIYMYEIQPKSVVFSSAHLVHEGEHHDITDQHLDRRSDDPSTYADIDRTYSFSWDDEDISTLLHHTH